MSHQPSESEQKKSSELSKNGATRRQRAGEAATTRVGMEKSDNSDLPATGVDPEQRSSTAE